jgi:hypothetical protein
VPGKPISRKTNRVLDLWHRHKTLPTSAIAERLGLRSGRVSQIIDAARKRGDPRAEYRACRNWRSSGSSSRPRPWQGHFPSGASAPLHPELEPAPGRGEGS